MDSLTLLWVILAFFFALIWSSWQYQPLNSGQRNLFYILFSLRTLGVFSILLLLINPSWVQKTVIDQKAPLYVVVDNSASVAFLKEEETVKKILFDFQKSSSLKDKFEVQFLAIDEEVRGIDSLQFQGKHSDLGKLGNHLRNIAPKRNYPVVLLSDGNQTKGKDFVYSFFENQTVHALVLGDTTTITDWKVTQVNHNKFALYQNQFPVEVFVDYTGKNISSAQVVLKKGGQIIQRKEVSLNKIQKTARVEWLVPATTVGLQTYQVEIVSNTAERNTKNNGYPFAVEVLDQRKKIALVTAIQHPDIAALKRAIQSNAYRELEVFSPTENKDFSAFSAVILYQPNASFSDVLKQVANARINYWLITGLHTDFGLVNQFQSDLDFEMSSQKEDYQTIYQSGFNLFQTDNIGFSEFPPLEHPFGNVSTKGNMQVLLQPSIRNIAINQPLFGFVENGNQRFAYLLGESLWKWRAASYRKEQNFEKFDLLIDKTIQFISSTQPRKRLDVSAENFYRSGEDIEIKAQFFNKNYEIDTNAELLFKLQIEGEKTKISQKMFRGASQFLIQLFDLKPGNYQWEVTEAVSKITEKGKFTILEFQPEEQFVQPNVIKMQQLATQQNGGFWLANQWKDVEQQLLQSNDFPIIEKSQSTRKAWIDWYGWLLLAVLFLSIEWFVRKYNGML
ncbi:MAG: hypothetical protein ACK4JX_10110 [Flavobacterium sp.]